ncbi:hypothetical protein [Owenweeksia hongkongensis]|uniref:hypothetical protein n=1 Tax=Owenweeksia hongkongensis TaxID=253245 RepID=UPI003A9436A4
MENYRFTVLLLLITIAGGSLFAQGYANDSKVDSKNNILIGFLADASMVNIKYERVIKPFNFGFVTAGVGTGLGMSGNSCNFLESFLIILPQTLAVASIFLKPE